MTCPAALNSWNPPSKKWVLLVETGSVSIYALGMAIAVTLSWARNASILWCVLHGIFSWGYVIYFAVTR